MAGAKRGVAELVVQGPAGQTFRQQFVEGQITRLGRAPASGWAISWDRSISREHADLCWKDGKLTVTCLPTAANPVRLRGAPLREIVVTGSESFEIGQSSFYVDVTYMPVTSVSSRATRLRSTRGSRSGSVAPVGGRGSVSSTPMRSSERDSSDASRRRARALSLSER